MGNENVTIIGTVGREHPALHKTAGYRSFTTPQTGESHE
ncbi:hypothetical protein MNB_SV-10-907 [hydrothermal vent metagenome]|uniref:Uncharacterized protein n=1 Tax=hydrothermal vent metagenome TaxID=652676 RepID=A0A1W1BJU8_9ZZZZ